jgi:Fic family protein
MYIYQRKGWPEFTWDQEKIMNLLPEVRYNSGRLIGKMEALGFSLKSEALLETMTLEALKSNEIEGEILNETEVRSSLALHLGLDKGGMMAADKKTEGVVEVIMEATQHFHLPLTEERLKMWHSALFPDGGSGKKKVRSGAWRKSGKPMQVVSGMIGRENVHFEAPDDKLVGYEMRLFLNWFNQKEKLDPVLKAAIAHLWFVTIHQFEDGNGRLARTITDMQLARADGIRQRFYSLSSQIRLERKAYYSMLEQTQKGTLDITPWVEWFLGCLNRSISHADVVLAKVLGKAKYWEYLSSKKINDRQRIIINKLLDDFEGKLTSTKYAKITKCSADTALRDIHQLIEQQILVKEPGGSKNTGYTLRKIPRQ